MERIIEFVNQLIEASTPSRPAWNIEHKLEDKPAKWNYIDGCMLKAVYDLYEAAGDEKYREFVKGYIDFYVNDDGEILGYSQEDYNCDNINMGKVLFPLHAHYGDEKYKKAIERLMAQLHSQPRISTGNFWHKQIYPNQVWLDGLYMVQPFYLAYESRFNGYKNYKDIFTQFEHVHNIMRDRATGLYYHGYDESRSLFWADKDTGLSPNFWSRSIGWFAMALVDTLDYMDEQFFYEHEALQGFLRELAVAILPFAHVSKLLYQVTDKGNLDGNYLETSGSAAIAYALMKGARRGHLPGYYFDEGKAIFDAIVAHKLILDDAGGFKLSDICLVAGLGGMPGKGDYKERDGSFAYYISEPKVDNDAKGVAPFLFAYAETIRRS